MHLIPVWREVSFLKNSFIQSAKAVTAGSSSTSIHLASFHSTPIHYEKWRKKSNFEIQRDEKPPKSYIRYAVRQKRSDAKKALKDLLYNCGCSKLTVEEWDVQQADHFGRSGKKGKSKSFEDHASKAHHKKKKRKFRREKCFGDYDDFDEDPENIYEARFGNNWHTWSFKSRKESSFQGSTSEFNWRGHPDWTNSRNKKWSSASETEFNDESYVIGSSSHRKILGLPSKSPLKIEDVKNAFRLSALKWHPDKHQGPSQAMAEEKFKDCANAYKSLCDALSAV